MWAAAASTAQAGTTLDVTTTADDPAAACAPGAPCSLRGAVAAANGDPGSTIEIPAGEYPLTVGPLEITAEGTTIVGAGREATSIVAAYGDNPVNNGTVLVSADSAQIRDLEIKNGRRLAGGNISYAAPLNGGQDWMLTLIRVGITDGSTETFDGHGGGIYQAGGTMRIVDSVISGNRSANAAALSVSRGRAVIERSTFHANLDTLTTGAAVKVLLGGSVTAVQSTFFDNRMRSGAGGATFNVESGKLTLRNSTVASPSSGSTGIVLGGASEATVVNSIIAGPDAGGQACAIAPGATMVDDHAMATDASCHLDPAHLSVENVDPQFGAFGDHGGLTPTLALTATSPLVDAGSSNPALCDPVDQRGAVRPQGAACDIGAFESPFTAGGTGNGPAAGGGSGGGGGGAGAPPVESAAPVPVAAAPEAPAAPSGAASTTPPTTSGPSLAQLSRSGRLRVAATLPGARGYVTLSWTVRHRGRLYNGKQRVTAVDGVLATSISLPRTLRGARLVQVVVLYQTADGARHRTVL